MIGSLTMDIRSFMKSDSKGYRSHLFIYIPGWDENKQF